MPNEKLGHISFLTVNMGTTAAPLFRQIQNEVEVSISRSADKVEVTSKSTGVYKKYKKTLLDATLSVKAYDDLSPTANFLTYKDISGLYELTNGSAGGTSGTGIGDGVFTFKIFSVTTGEVVQTFDGFVDSLSKPMVNMDKIEYTFNIQPIGVLTPTTI